MPVEPPRFSGVVLGSQPVGALGRSGAQEMKRNPELHPLSEHHHHVLVLALEIRRAAESSGPDRDERLQELARDLLGFGTTAARPIFKKKSRSFYPSTLDTSAWTMIPK